ISTAQSQLTSLSLGSGAGQVYETIFMLDSYERGIGNTSVAYPQGLAFSLYSGTSETKSTLTKRLNELRNKALGVEKLFTELLGRIYVQIEFPRLEKSDLKGLEAGAGIPFAYLEK